MYIYEYEYNSEIGSNRGLGPVFCQLAEADTVSFIYYVGYMQCPPK